MEWIDRLSDDVTGDNIEALLALFPDVATEVRGDDGELHRAVDYDALREKLGDVAEGGRERYQFTWPGKREARAEASRRIDKVLRPCVEESKDWDTTQNLYIEGDNLDALKILRKNYAGKIKMIYIDPPYNTGNDFIYDDDFAVSREEYTEQSGDSDERGQLVVNRDTNGRFHSDWCSMMLPRLLLARDLLSDDGVIFISISAIELYNLKKICDDVYRIENYITCFIWEKTQHFGRQKLNFYENAEFILCYAKNKIDGSQKELLVERVKTDLEDAPLYNASNAITNLEFPIGTVRFNIADGIYTQSDSEDYCLLNDVIVTNGTNSNAFTLRFKSRWSNETLKKEIEKGTRFWIKTKKFAIRAIYSANKTSNESPRQILFTNNRNPLCTVNRFGKRVGTSENGTSEIEVLMDNVFNYPKPTGLIEHLISLAWDFNKGCSSNNFTIIDFFSGSGTTAEAIFNLNAEDEGNRNFIMIQFPEICPEQSMAFQSGFPTITEVGKERIRRAGAKTAAEVKAANIQLGLGSTFKTVPDISFRVLKIDSSNYDDVTVTLGAANQAALAGWADNIKPDRTSLDLLFSVFGDLSIPYSASIETLPRDQFSGHEVFSVQDGSLVACFDTDLDNATIEAMAKLEPSYCVVRDASFEDDAASTNFEELFKTFSPATKLRVL